jgi:hypothetical protein
VRTYLTSYVDRKRAKHVRDTNREAGKCINAPLVGDQGKRVFHGPPVSGWKCAHCVAVAKGKRN